MSGNSYRSWRDHQQYALAEFLTSYQALQSKRDTPEGGPDTCHPQSAGDGQETHDAPETQDEQDAPLTQTSPAQIPSETSSTEGALMRRGETVGDRGKGRQDPEQTGRPQTTEGPGIFVPLKVLAALQCKKWEAESLLLLSEVFINGRETDGRTYTKGEELENWYKIMDQRYEEITMPERYPDPQYSHDLFGTVIPGRPEGELEQGTPLEQEAVFLKTAMAWMRKSCRGLHTVYSKRFVNGLIGDPDKSPADMWQALDAAISSVKDETTRTTCRIASAVQQVEFWSELVSLRKLPLSLAKTYDPEDVARWKEATSLLESAIDRAKEVNLESPGAEVANHCRQIMEGVAEWWKHRQGGGSLGLEDFFKSDDHTVAKAEEFQKNSEPQVLNPAQLRDLYRG